MFFFYIIFSLLRFEPELAKTDSVVKPFYSNEKIKQYKSKKEYDYSEKQFQGNAIYQFLNMLNNYISYFLGKFLGDYLIYIIIIIALIFFILQASGLKINSFFRNSSSNKKKISYSVEDLSGIDLEKALNDAIQAQNYNLAMRFLYLKTIENLVQGNVIKHDPSKTNKDYLSEIKSLPFKKEFKLLTLYFDSVCYGEFNLEANEFSVALKTFEDLKTQLVLAKK